MRKAEHHAGGRDRGRGDRVWRIYRAAWLYGGIPFLVLTAILIAAGRAPGLADFLFWLAVIWMVMVRYAEFGCLSEGSLQPCGAALRRWRRFSAILVVAGGVLYALAKVAATGS
jgi:hypothetical protein